MVTAVSSSAIDATVRARPKSSSFTPLRGEEDVRRLQIAVHDAAAVQRRQRRQDRQLRRRRLGDGHGPAGQPLGERLAVEQFHAEERLPLVFADVEQLADVRMADGSRGARLAKEALAHLRLRRAKDRLDRDRPRQPVIPAFVDDTHPAATDFPDDAVGTYGVRHGRRGIGMSYRRSAVGCQL